MFSSTQQAAMESDTSGSSDTDDMVEAPATKERAPEHKKSGSVVFLPSDILKRPNLVPLATRLKMTSMQQAVFTHGLVEEAGGETHRK